ncbi:hypothetical protein TNCV_2039501 [Trichonephila clavipes]|nr:hypothetical protein TNCV_2039501 [Trichonephila clavipes]
MSEGRFDLSTFRSERTNEASTLTITPKRSSSRDVGTRSYRHHTATYPPASVSANRRTNDTIFVASIVRQLQRVAPGLKVTPGLSTLANENYLRGRCKKLKNHEKQEAVEYLFSEELESKMIALPPEVDKLTDEEGFDDTNS